jgi:rRNA-processing protein EBP2
MGKKAGGKRKRDVIDEEEEEQEAFDEELEAEMAALKAMRSEAAEAEEAATGKPTGTDNNVDATKTNYNRDGLVKALDGIESRNLPFVETLQLCEFSIDVEDDNDDLQREMAFYQQTLEAAKAGRSRLESLGVPTRRPVDFFCENVKSDAHMNRIKDRLILEEKKIDAFDKRKNREVNRKYEKQVAAIRKQEKSKQVKDEIGQVQKLWKGRNGSDREALLNETLQQPTKSKKRMAMDRKYGSGVKEKMKKKLGDKK